MGVIQDPEQNYEPAEELTLPLYEIALAPLRNKGGRPRAFDNADQFLERATAYFRYCHQNPVLTNNRRHQRREDGRDIRAQSNETVPQPFTITGLLAFCHIHMDWESFKRRYGDPQKTKDADKFNDIFRVCEHIIREQQIKGALVGVYHPNIVSRLNGLVEKTEQYVEAKVKNLSYEDYVRLLNGEEVEG